MRSSGILLHITSLPSPYGVGTMGKAAREFVDFLKKASQTHWQILPICPTSYGDSPYQSFSTYAGNPYFIDLDMLAEDGLLQPEEYKGLEWGNDPAQVDFALLYQNRFPVLRKACARLLKANPKEISAFCEKHRAWLPDYALFMALKMENDGKSWSQWPDAIRLRQPKALAEAKTRLTDDINFWECVQYLFYTQWFALKDYANENGISIIGDVPIYVAGDSVDVWANPGQFQLDKNLTPKAVAGCPPDGFCADGQLWGNPLFDWSAMKKDGYTWWIARIAHQCAIYDVVRIDHFRAFEAYYSIPYGDATAVNGTWKKGPGYPFFKAVEAALGKQNIIAEDLGFLTEGVYKLLEKTGFPGMKVLQFAFDSPDGGGYLPHSIPQNSVAYVGTHDNDTTVGWFATAPAQSVQKAFAYMRLRGDEGLVWGTLRTLWACSADLAISTMQDLQALGGFARMNTPATPSGNWQWRSLKGGFSDQLAQDLANEMETFCRLPLTPEVPTDSEELS